MIAGKWWTIPGQLKEDMKCQEMRSAYSHAADAWAMFSKSKIKTALASIGRQLRTVQDNEAFSIKNWNHLALWGKWLIYKDPDPKIQLFKKLSSPFIVSFKKNLTTLEWHVRWWGYNTWLPRLAYLQLSKVRNKQMISKITTELQLWSVWWKRYPGGNKNVQLRN